MTKTRKSYSGSQKREAVQAVQGGASTKEVGKSRGIPARMLPKEAEECIFQWVVARQMMGVPVGRQATIRKASEITTLMDGKGVGDGWYRGFLSRYPELGNRRSEAVTKDRNAITGDDITALFWSVAKVVIEHNMDASRIFNVDETAFESGRKSTCVIALRGSRNVWHTDPTISFHLSIVACASAGFFLVPPLFILPGERVDNHILEGCQQLPGAAVTTTDSAFMNGNLFAKWLHFFSAALPAEIKRPVLLIMDGCSSHIMDYIVETAEMLQIILICLPANGTHLLQPLDVAVFAAFKSKLKTLIDNLVTGNGETSISKPKSLQLAALAWVCSNVAQNISSGFATCGIYPLSMVKMTGKLTNFQRNGLAGSVQQAAWLRVKDTVQHDILTLPPPRKSKARKRKTTTVAGRILTRDMFVTSIAPRKKPRKQQKQKASKKPRQQQCPSTDDVLYVAIV